MSANETGMDGACEQMLLRMSSALDGNLSDHELTGLSSHLAGCSPCRTRASEMRTADGLFRQMEPKWRSVPPALDTSFAQQVMDRLRRGSAPMGGVLEFTRLVAQDPTLQNELRPAASMDRFVELFVSVGRQRGYNFGSGEVVSLLAARSAANDDLSDEQLNAVIGGVGPGDAALHAFVGDVLQNWFKPPIK